jgi:Domain of unknown function (DUF4394)
VPRSTTLLRRGAVAAAVLALAGAAGADASRDRGGDRGNSRDDSSRIFYATTDQNLLLQFNERNPDRLRDLQAIRGLPAGTTLRGIDFRPATGDLYGVGSDNIVYRVNVQTGIAVSEGPAFTPGLNGQSFGFDFNPTVDKIRLTSDAGQNQRLNPDEGTTLLVDGNLNPGTPQVVGSAYTNSSFVPFSQKPMTTTLYAVDAATDQLFVQNPPNDGTLTMPKRLRIDVGQQTGFDIAGADNTGYIATSGSRSRGTSLYKVDVLTGKTRELGRVGGGRRLVVTGLAAWQD